MSGHSKWSTIKRQKAANDAVKGNLFSKLSRAISIAVKTGGGDNPDTNYKLRIAVDAARQANMPKENIERAIARGQSQDANLEEITYEGFGPGGVSLMVEATSDNKNRTGQEIKNIFEKSGGRFAGPGSVSFNFASKGMILVSKKDNESLQDLILSLIDTGAEEIEEAESLAIVFVPPKELFDYKELLKKKGFNVQKAQLVQKPLNFVVPEKADAQKIASLIKKLEDHSDVQRVYSNLSDSSINR